MLATLKYVVSAFITIFLVTQIACGSNGIFLLNQSFFQAKRVKSAAKIKPGLIVGFAKDYGIIRSFVPLSLSLRHLFRFLLPAAGL
jgi:hypothetical protein